MKKILCSIVIITISCNLFSQVTVPNSFSGGGTISASEMNNNFQALVEEINSMKDEISTLVSDLNTAESTIVNLESLISSNTTSLTNVEIFPIGSVVSSILPPTDFMASMGSAWVLADGRDAPNEYMIAFSVLNIPDLRGMFLRGLNEGRSDGNEDPDGGGRVAADQQEDAFQDHKHGSNTLSNNSPASFVLGFGSDFAVFRDVESRYFEGDIPGIPRVSAETRPKNISVYYYIKVR